MEWTPEQAKGYAEAFSTPESDVLKKLNRNTYAKVLRPRMLSGHLQGRLLSFISRILQPRVILDIGTFTGYSAICLAEGLEKNGILHTIDHNPELKDFAASYIHEAGLTGQIKQHTGDAMGILPNIPGPIDLAFLDADKREYVQYFELIYPKLRAGGIVMADNVLWGGKVIDQHTSDDPETSGIRRFNDFIRNHQGVQQLLLPFRDGLMLIQKNQ